jgi:hypothetical protein
MSQTTQTKETLVQNLKGKVKKILEIAGQKLDHVTAKKIEIVTSMKDAVKRGVGKVSDKVQGKKAPDDFNRRIKRVAELIDLSAGNDLLKTACDKAENDVKALDYFKQHPSDKWRDGIAFGQDDVDISKDYAQLGVIAAELAEARTAADEQEADLRKAFPTQAKLLDDARMKLESAAMPTAARERLEKDLVLARNKFLATGGKNTPKELPKDINTAIGQLSGNIEIAIVDARKKAAELRKEHEKLTETFVNFQGPDKKRLELQAMLDDADLAIRGYDFDAAKDKLTKTEQKLNEATGGKTTDVLQQRRDLDGKIETLKQSFITLTKAFSEVQYDPAMQRLQTGAFWIDTTLQTAMLLIAKGETLPTDIGKTVDTAIAEAERLLKVVRTSKGIDKTSELYKSLKPKDDEIQKKCDELSHKAGEIYATLAFGAPDPNVKLDKRTEELRAQCTGPIQDQIAALRKRSGDALAMALTARDYEPEYNAVMSELTKIEKNLSADTPDVGCTKTQLEAKIEFDRFEHGIAGLETAASDLMTNNSTALKTPTGELVTEFLDGPGEKRKAGETLIAEAHGDWQKMTEKQTGSLRAVNEEIAALLDRILKAKPSGGPDLDELRKICKTYVDGYTRRIDEVIKTNDRSKETKKGLVTYAAALKTDMAVLAAPAVPGASSDPVLLQAAADSLGKFEQRVKAFENMKTNKLEEQSKQPSFKMSEDTLLPDIKKRLQHSLFEARADDPALQEQKAIVDKYDGDKLYKHDPAVAKTELGNVQGALQTLQVQFQKDKDEADKMAADLQRRWDLLMKATKDPTGYPQVATAPTAIGVLLGDLKREHDRLGTAQKFDAARHKDLVDRYDMFMTADPGKANARAKVETDSKEAQEKCEKVRFDLEQLRDVDIVLLKERADGLGKEEKNAMLEQLKDMQTAINSTLKGLTQHRNAESAESMFKAIRSRLNKMAAQPMGTKSLKRNQIPKCVTLWKNSVKTIKSDLETLGKTVESYLDDPTNHPTVTVEKAEVTTIVNALKSTATKVESLFPEDAFDSAVKQLLAAGPSQEQALGAREEALRTVRRLRRVLSGNAAVRALGTTPFEPKPAFPAAMNALFVLETNLLTSDI